LDGLAHDNQERAAWIQFVGAGVSLASWVLRFWVIKSPDDDAKLKNDKKYRPMAANSPLMLLGGSMATIDASTAVLMAFSEPPLLLSTVSRFDNTARLLTGLLVSLVALHRCLFSCACVAITLEAGQQGRLTFTSTYENILWSAACMWLYQAIGLAVLLVDLVATPMAFALGRDVAGGHVTVRTTTIFLVLVGFSIPKLMTTCVELGSNGRKSEKL
jgi:hypothetical protein